MTPSDIEKLLEYAHQQCRVQVLTGGCLTINELAAYFGLSPNTIRSAVCRMRPDAMGRYPLRAFKEAHGIR